VSPIRLQFLVGGHAVFLIVWVPAVVLANLSVVQVHGE